MVLYVHKRWNGLVRRVHPRTEDTNIEWIHVRMDSTPALNIFGVHFDGRPRVDEAKSFLGQVRNKLDRVRERREGVLLLGDLTYALAYCPMSLKV